MSLNNENQVVSEFNELNISDKNSNSLKTNHENCYDPENQKFWCKECVPRCIIEGWTSGNDDVDNFIKDTIYNAGSYGYPIFLEWVPFDRFENMKQIGEGGFAKVYSATWIDGKAVYYKRDDGSWIKKEHIPFEVALKRLNGSQNMSADFLNELKTHWSLYCIARNSLEFYGMTKDPKTKEFIMIMQFADKGNLRSILSSNFNNIAWNLKIFYLYESAIDLRNLHSMGFFHKDFHSGNILNIALEICNGLRPEFGKGTPEIYKKLAHRCMNANPNQRPTANELYEILKCWYNYSDNNKYDYKREEVEAAFREADKEIPNISISYEKDPDAIYTSRVFTFKNLSEPINSSFITTLYLNDEEDNKDCQDSQLFDLEVPNTSKLDDNDN
ncbi:kinase-like domain-containing protein [Rhizophagus clarus]|uniref:Kinase-like domain-containing protein n=1 Tax=Rhizophagus clarus TaxID=94130 RepID=A0A8H3LFR8_9GLOM|nr:kinase-like domain-containing protein [Rhizophagus clarus]